MRAMVAAGLWLAATGAALVGSDTYVFSAKYVEPTTRYAHGVLGDAVEWGALSLTIDGCPQSAQACPRTVTYRLPEDRVFEDIAPRLVDVDCDGFDEVVVIETQVNRGASLAVYGAQGKLAAQWAHLPIGNPIRFPGNDCKTYDALENRDMPTALERCIRKMFRILGRLFGATAANLAPSRPRQTS